MKMKKMKDESISLSAEDAPVKIVETRESRGSFWLKVCVRDDLYEELYRFLGEYGGTHYGRDRAIIAILIEYGLSEVAAEDLLNNMDTMKDQLSSYAAMRFQTYEYYLQNNAITQGLHYFLSKNESLKRQLRKNGLVS